MEANGRTTWYTGWFSEGEHVGRLQHEGGWVMWAVDKAGSKLFGAVWPVVGWTALATLMVGLLAILTHSLRVLTAPCCWVGGCLARLCPSRRSAEAVELDRILPAPRPVEMDVAWHGPATGWPVTTEYYAQRVEGRGSQ